MLPWLLWIRAYVEKSTAVVLPVPPLVFLGLALPCEQQYSLYLLLLMPLSDMIPANFPAAHRTQSSSGELTGGLFVALCCCLAKLLTAADTLERSLCRLKTTLHWFTFSSIWMIIFASVKSKNIFFQIKSSGFKYVAASGFSFPPSPTCLSVKNFFLNTDRWKRFVSCWQKDMLL